MLVVPPENTITSHCCTREFKYLSFRDASAMQWSSDFVLLKPFVINLLSLKAVSPQTDLQALQRDTKDSGLIDSFKRGNSPKGIPD